MGRKRKATSSGRPKRKAPPPKPVVVMIEMGVGRDTSPEVILGLAGRWESLGFRLDRGYRPVRLRPRKEHREPLEAAGIEVVMVRGILAPDRFEEVQRQPLVRRVWRDAPLEPAAKRRSPRPGPRSGQVPPPPVPRPRPPHPPFPPPRPPRPPFPPVPPIGRRQRPPRPPIIPKPGKMPRIALVDCARAGNPVGTLAEVATYLGVDQIHALGFRGDGIVVGMVDFGITAIGRPVLAGQAAEIANVVGGWPANDWGTTALAFNQHGNMTATDVLGIAPNAQLWDIRIWTAQAFDPLLNFSALASNAVAGYRAAIDNFVAAGVPQILSNSFALHNRDNGLDFATDPDHPFATLVEEALDTGMLVLFAAGNCGGGCSFSARCGPNDRGPGNSILGPNGHPRVMTVGAANLLEQWCGFTSQGPAVLPPNAADKPDFCALSHFDGYFPSLNVTQPFDSGTSAATPIAAGVVALLKQKRGTLTQDEAKTALRNTAKDIRALGFDTDSGAGIIQGKAAFDTI